MPFEISIWSKLGINVLSGGGRSRMSAATAMPRKKLVRKNVQLKTVAPSEPLARTVLGERVGYNPATGKYTRYAGFYDDAEEAGDHLDDVLRDPGTRTIVYAEYKGSRPASLTVEREKYDWDKRPVYYIHEVVKDADVVSAYPEVSRTAVPAVMSHAHDIIGSSGARRSYILVENMALFGYYKKKYDYRLTKVIGRRDKKLKSARVQPDPKNPGRYIYKGPPFKYIQMHKNLPVIPEETKTARLSGGGRSRRTSTGLTTRSKIISKRPSNVSAAPYLWLRLGVDDVPKGLLRSAANALSSGRQPCFSGDGIAEGFHDIAAGKNPFPGYFSDYITWLLVWPKRKSVVGLYQLGKLVGSSTWELYNVCIDARYRKPGNRKSPTGGSWSGILIRHMNATVNGIGDVRLDVDITPDDYDEKLVSLYSGLGFSRVPSEKPSEHISMRLLSFETK